MAVLVGLAGCGRLGFDVLPGDGGVELDGASLPADAFACASPAQAATAFDAPSPAWFYFTDPLMNPAVSYAIVGGSIAFSLVANEPSPRYGFYQSVCPYDMRGRTVSVQVVGLPEQIAGVELGLFMGSMGGVGISVQNDTVTAFDNVAGFTGHAANSFTLATNGFLRIAETGGTTLWQTAPSASGPWSTLFSTANRVDMSNIYLQLFVGAFVSRPAPGTVRFDNVSVN